MANSLLVLVIISLSLAAIGLFFYLLNWLRENKSTEPLRFNILTVITAVCGLFGFAFLSLILEGISNGSTGLVPTFLLLVGCVVSGVLLSLGSKRRCPTCGRLGVVETTSKEYQETFMMTLDEHDSRNRSTGKYKYVPYERYEFTYNCTACSVTFQKQLIRPKGGSFI